MALFAEPLLLAWTGDTTAAQMAAPILFWYGLANATIGLLLMPFLLQFAYGRLRLHVIGNAIMVVLFLPMMVIAAVRFGGAGAGAALLIANLAFLVFWVPLVHRRLMPEIVWRWPLLDVGCVAAPVILFLMLARQLMPNFESRFALVLFLGVILLLALTAGLLLGNRSRELLFHSTENPA